MARRKQRVGEMFIVFYDNDKLILDKIDELVELTGVKKEILLLKHLNNILKLILQKAWINNPCFFIFFM